MSTMTVSIRKIALPEHEKAIEKLNRRATKNNVPGVAYTVSGEYSKEEPRYPFDHPFYSYNDTIERKYVDLTFSIETVGIGGYRPIATLDYHHSEALSFVWPGESIGDTEIPSYPMCDHCGKHRSRTRVFILEHESGKRNLVGTTCVRDFIGYDPVAIIEQLSIIRKLKDIGDDDDMDFRGGKRKNFDVGQIAVYTAALIREYGWVSGKRAMESYDRDDKPLVSTAGRAGDYIIDRKEDPRIKVNDEDRELAKKVVEYVGGIENPKNDYARNLSIIARDGYCRVKEFNLVVSMVNFAVREMERDAELENAAETKPEDTSKHIGNVGDRLVLDEVRLESVKEIGSAYGITYLTKFLTAGGDRVTWFASKYLNCDDGDVVTLTGTVKAHNEFQGKRETIMTRCRISNVRELAVA